MLFLLSFLPKFALMLQFVLTYLIFKRWSQKIIGCRMSKDFNTTDLYAILGLARFLCSGVASWTKWRVCLFTRQQAIFCQESFQTQAIQLHWNHMVDSSFLTELLADLCCYLRSWLSSVQPDCFQLNYLTPLTQKIHWCHDLVKTDSSEFDLLFSIKTWNS